MASSRRVEGKTLTPTLSGVPGEEEVSRGFFTQRSVAATQEAERPSSQRTPPLRVAANRGNARAQTAFVSSTDGRQPRGKLVCQPAIRPNSEKREGAVGEVEKDGADRVATGRRPAATASGASTLSRPGRRRVGAVGDEAVGGASVGNWTTNRSGARRRVRRATGGRQVVQVAGQNVPQDQRSELMPPGAAAGAGPAASIWTATSAPCRG